MAGLWPDNLNPPLAYPDEGTGPSRLPRRSPLEEYIPPEIRDIIPSSDWLAYMGTSMLPGAGGAIDATEASAEYQNALDAARAGQYGQAVTSGLLGAALTGSAMLDYFPATAMLPAAAPLARAARTAPPPPIRAYHGSPHDFDKFSMEHIGTGEGAQAYGHGLYFAEREGVARAYRDQLTGPPLGIDPARAKRMAKGGMPSVKRRLKAINKQLEGEARWKSIYGEESAHGRYLSLHNEKEALKDIIKTNDLGPLKEGRMYKVEIDADPAEFIEWDRPMNEQSQAVRDYADIPKGDIRNEYAAKDVIPMLEEAQTKALSEAGIPGVKYLDQGSRTAGDGSHNFVLFRDDIVKIVKKYGIAGTAIALGLTQAEVAQAMDKQSGPPLAPVEYD